ncbi:MAG: putative deoxyribonuclease YcfH [Marine Group I thaumarchaeote]|nr:MAG: putative deoxyribonuclease YcfH [Marine Group I thaumarchaeote]
MTWIFDSHIHLSDPEFEKDIPLIIKSMEKLHIKACCVSMDNSNSIQTLNLANKSELILPFIGIHPEKFKDSLEDMTGLIEQNKDKISGIGEIGLDKTYVESDVDYSTQKQVFETLLSLAEKHKKPVSIHSRKTLDDIFEIISSYSLSGVLLHWFDGNKKQLQQAMDMKFFVSYGPVMLYATDKQILLSKTDQDKILVETDGPVRFSKCFGFKPAQVTFIPSVVFCGCKVLRKSYDEFSTILEKNSMNYLGI